MKTIIIALSTLISLTSAHASAGGGGGHGGGGPKTRTVRAASSADHRAKDGSPHAALTQKTHQGNPSLS